MSDEQLEEIPKGRPWMLALGVGLAVGAGALYAWSRLRPCDCEEGTESLPFKARAYLRTFVENDSDEDTETPSDPELASRRSMHHAIVNRVRTSYRGMPLAPEPDPLAWDTHAENAWGLNVGGARKLDDYRVVDEAEAEELN